MRGRELNSYVIRSACFRPTEGTDGRRLRHALDRVQVPLLFLALCCSLSGCTGLARLTPPRTPRQTGGAAQRGGSGRSGASLAPPTVTVRQRAQSPQCQAQVRYQFPTQVQTPGSPSSTPDSGHLRRIRSVAADGSSNASPASCELAASRPTRRTAPAFRTGPSFTVAVTARPPGTHPWNISRMYAANRMRWTQPCMTFAWPLANVMMETPRVTISSHSSVCSTPRISGWPVR
jgi:hypothetical protein